MFKRIVFLAAVLLLLTGTTLKAVDAPEMQWHKGYGTSYGNHPHEGMQTSDGGYIAIGQTWDSADYPEMFVVKTNSSGNKEWQKIVGASSQPDIGICVAEVSDGFICGGGLYDGNMKRALVKLNKASGNIVSGWPKYYSGSQNCAIRGIEILGDGSIVATGYVNSPESGFLFICDDGDGFIMKTDSSGNLVWDKTLSVPQGTKVRQISTGFAVCSTAWYYDGGDHQDAVLIKTDSNGNETNKYHYGGTGDDLCYDFDLTSDGGYILGGHTTSYGVANWDYYFVKVNSSGVEQWHKTFGQPRGYDANYIHDEGYAVRQTPDGGYIIAGGSGDEYSYSDCSHPAGCSDEWKAYLVKTDSSGNVQWQGVYPNQADVGNTAAEYIGLTSDGGYIVFTDTDCFYDTVGSFAFGFMKIEPEHNYSGGAGEPNNPYRIATPNDLNTIRQYEYDWDEHFVLINDINIAEYSCTAALIAPDVNNTYSGFQGTAFTGVFDGNNHTISNFNCAAANGDYIGLFGYVSGTQAQVKNLTLLDPNVSGDSYVGALVGDLAEGKITNCNVQGGRIIGDDDTGGLIGRIEGNLQTEITNCFADDCNVTGGTRVGTFAGSSSGTIQNCYAQGNCLVLTSRGIGGGLLGYNGQGLVTECFSLCDINGGGHIGGLIGATDYGNVANCYSLGSVDGLNMVGGLIGYNHYGPVENCYTAADVLEGKPDITGALIGDDVDGIFQNCFWDSDVNPDVNGIGNTTDPNVIGKTTVELQTESTFTNAGWDFLDIWKFRCEGMSYPRLIWQTTNPPDYLCPDGVGFEDFAAFAQQWLNTACGLCGGADLTGDGNVDYYDLQLFVEQWLQNP